ncbi:MAG: metallophosphoesterase [Deltaproteobacteria bacterium]|nr:MAG: metallophosphoesterase [Deltaproteobacteria bacterium]
MNNQREKGFSSSRIHPYTFKGEVERKVYVVGDLHLSEGRDVMTRKFSKNEDFFFDEEFSDFVTFILQHAQEQNYKFDLIINGDLLDFPQVISPVYDENRKIINYQGYYSGFGPDTSEFNSVLKLRKVMQGHVIFFRSLAKIIEQGHRIVIITGNHDIEFQYSDVRKAFKAEIMKYIEDSSRNENIIFQRCFHIDNGVYIEHGSQYDKYNSFVNFLAPYVIKRFNRVRLEMSFGSYFVKYVLNRIEHRFPFADNFKKRSSFINWLFIHHPLQALLIQRHYIYLSLIIFFGKILPYFFFWKHRGRQRAAELNQLKWKQCGDEYNLSSDQIKKLHSLHKMPIFEYARITGKYLYYCTTALVLLYIFGWWQMDISGIIINYFAKEEIMIGSRERIAVFTVSTIGFLVLIPLVIYFGGRFIEYLSRQLRNFYVFLLNAFPYRIRKRYHSKFYQYPVKAAHLSKVVKRISQILNDRAIKYVILSHYHDADIIRLEDGKYQYLNTGTWTKVFCDQEDRLLREDRQFSLVQVIYQKGSSEPRAFLQEWKPEENRLDLIRIFETEMRT